MVPLPDMTTRRTPGLALWTAAMVPGMSCAMGERSNAARFYEAVTAYQEHPRAWDAQEALKRLKGG